MQRTTARNVQAKKNETRIERLRLAVVMTGLTLGGAEMMLWKLLSRLDRDRFEPMVITVNDTTAMLEHFKRIGIDCQVLGLRSAFGAPNKLLRLVRILRSFKPDIIQGWMYHGNLTAALSAMLMRDRPPVLWNVRGALTDLMKEKRQLALTIWLGGRLSFVPAKIINNSKVSAIQHEQQLGYRAEKRVVLPNGFDTDLFRPVARARAEVRKALQVSQDTVLVGLVGRYHPMKDPANFMRAAALLAPLFPKLCFVLAGHEVDVRNADLARLISEHGLRDRVHLLGRRDDMHVVMAGLDVLVSSSSRGEGFPNVVGEAMSCGVPCVVTDVGDSGWVVGDTGTVVPAGNSIRLARAVQELLAMDGDARNELGVRARQRILDNFSLDAIVRQYEELYLRVWQESEWARKG